MQKSKKEIIKILGQNSIMEDFIEEIIIKDEKNLLISIIFDKFNLPKDEIAKIVQKAEENIKKQLDFDKITMILASNAKKAVKKTPPKKNKEGFLHKIKKKLNFLQDSPQKAQKPPQKAQNLPKNSQKVSEIQNIVGVKKVIAVASAKGGVGKSTFAVNLAASLKKIGHKVALLDADIYGPSIPVLLGINEKPEIKNNLLQPIVKFGMKIMSIGLMIKENEAGVWRGAMITKILYQLIRTVDWKNDGQEVDFMIIDMPPGTGDIYLSLAQNFPIDGVVIVSTPQMVAVKDVARSIDCFEKLKIPIIGLVQNMAYIDANGSKQYIFGKDNAKNMAQELKIKFLGDIELAQEISDANEASTPFMIDAKASNLSLNFGKIAEDIIEGL